MCHRVIFLKSWICTNYLTSSPDFLKNLKVSLISWLKVKVKISQSRQTLCNSMDYTVHGILQARILKWVSFPFSREHSQPRDRIWVSPIAGGFFTSWASREAGNHQSSIQFSSVTQSCLTLCHPMDCIKSGLLVHHQLPELAQTHVHQVGDAIQASYPLSSPSVSAFNLSQNQGLFQWVSCSSHQVVKVLEFQL